MMLHFVSSEEEWRVFCRLIGEPSWTKEERFTTAEARRRNREELDRLVEEWTRRHDHYQAMRLLQGVGVAAAPVLGADELVRDPHLNARGFFQWVQHPETGSHLNPGMPWKLSKTPGRIRRPAPRFAEHNEYVLGELLGMSRAEMAQLERDGVTAMAPLG